ncbi:MAG: septum formation protein Maf [Bacteroidetes bacterium]|nr:septum formation protein Maf [Bacteroidota bacterium]
MKKLLLGSNSPRRKELLTALGYDFRVVKIDCDESFPKNMPAHQVAAYISQLKSEAYKNLQSDEILLTSDTVVAIDEEILGKPIDKVHAKEMLQKLSGKTHQVYTAVTVKTNEKHTTITDVAEVSVLELTNQDIEYYLDKHQPYDKAGSYGVQEWLGMAKINKINGSFYTIMGLPTHCVDSLLKEWMYEKHSP